MFKNIFSTFGTKVINAIISIILLLLTTNYFGAEGRGVISIITASTGLINLFSSFLGGSALVYLLPRNKNQTFLSQILFVSYVWAFFVSGIITIILILTKSIPKDSINHIFLLGVLISLFSIHTVVLLAFEKILLQNVSNVSQILTNFVIFGSLIFLFKIVSVSSFILSLYLSYIFGLLLSFLFVLKNFPKEKKKISIYNSIRENFKFGFVCQLGNVIQYLNYRLSYYILNYYTSIALVGIYSVGVMVSEAIWMIPRSISLVQYSRIANSNDLNYSRELTLKLAKLSFITTLFMVFLFILLPAEFFSAIFGKDFKSVKEVMLYLSTGISIFGYTVIISHYFAGTGKYIINTKAAFLGLIITLIVNFILVPKYGHIGAAIATSLSYLTTGLFLVVSFLKETGITINKLLPSINDIEFAINRFKKVRKK